MKLLKSLALGALALAAVSVASATNVRVTGSSAFRKALFASVIDNLGGVGAVKVAYVGTSLGSANQATFTNGTDSVQACMAGSVGGVDWVVHSTNVATAPGGDTTRAWIKVSTAAAAVAPTLGGGPGYSLGGGTGYANNAAVDAVTGWDSAGIADFAMSDSYQDSTPFDSTSTGVTLTPAGGGDLGVVQFVMAKGKLRLGADAAFTAAYGRLTNVSGLAFQNLAANGKAPLSAFTGVASDSNYWVVLVGRDSDSGTRLGTTFETGVGPVNTAMTQYFGFDGAAGTGNNIGLVAAAGNIKSLTTAGGPVNGYASGSGVKRMMDKDVDSTAVLSAKPFILLGYMGTGDAPAVASQILTYNGNAYNAATSASTILGQYTFWTVEQAYYLPTLNPAKAAIADAIASGVSGTYATAAAGILMTDMLCARGSEGTVVAPF